MSLRIPLPNAPAGSVMEGMGQANALHQQNLENYMKQLQNQYYAPNIQSQIAERQALTKGYDIANQFAPERLRLANELSQQNLQFNPQRWQSEMALQGAQTREHQLMDPLRAQQLQQQVKYYPQVTEADIESKKALSQYRQAGGAGIGVGQKEMQGFINQLQNERPDWSPQQVNQAASSYLSGQNTLPDGTPLPEPSGIAGSYIAQIRKRGSTAAIQNQSANMDILYDDLKKFDIDAVKSMAGPQGRAKLAYAKAKMITNPNDPNIDPMARRYFSAMNQTIINMDTMRKAFGTSVVPDYVYKTIGRLTNPNDSIFNDPKQIEQNFNAVIDSINNQRKTLNRKASFGATAQLPIGSEQKKATRRYNPQTGKLEHI